MTVIILRNKVVFIAKIQYYTNTNPSILERRVAHLLDKADLIYVTELSFSDLKSGAGNLLRFDFGIFISPEDLEAENVKFLIEANGEQHYRPKFTSATTFALQQANDKRKRHYCSVKNIPLVEIPYTEFNSITIDSILEAGKYFE